MLTFRRKLALNKTQATTIDSWIDTCRFIYNLSLEVKKEAWRIKQVRVSGYELGKQLTEIRSYDWISDVPRNCLENAISRMDSAYNRFLSGVAKYPKWASKKTYKSIGFRSGQKDKLWIKGNHIRLNKIGELKMFSDKPVNGNIKTVVIKKEAEGYFAYITTDEVKHIQPIGERQVVGIDMGISRFCTGSNGFVIQNPRFINDFSKKITVEHRSLSRKKAKSGRWVKQKNKLARLHTKIHNKRLDFLHKESTNLSKLFHTVYMEDLKIKNMVLNKNLSKHILDCGWGKFRQLIGYKTRVVLIDPKFTSQICNQCGNLDAKSRISQSKFICTGCGTVMNADDNAAKIILGRGIALDRERKTIV